MIIIFQHIIKKITTALADLEGGCCNPPFQISKIKESNKTRQKIEDNPLEKELHVCLVVVCTRVNTCINKHISFSFYSSTPL